MEAPGVVLVLTLHAECAADSSTVSYKTTTTGQEVPMADNFSHIVYVPANFAQESDCES